MQTTPPRQKTWFNWPCLCKSSHLHHIYICNMDKGTQTKTLLGTFKWLNLLLQIRFLSFSRASEYFRLTNLTITFLSWPLLYLESGSLWQPSISFGSISTPESLQYLPCSQDLYQECCSVCLIFQRCFCGYIAPPSPDFFQDKLLRSSLRLTFFTIALSLWSFLFSV